MKNKNILKTIAVVSVLALYGVLAIGSDDSSSSNTGGDNYDYHDAAGNGYNDDDVNWDGGGKGNKSKSWDQAVDDWNRANGYGY